MIMMIKYDMLIAHAISKTKDKYAMYNKIREMVVLLTAYRLDGLRTWALGSMDRGLSLCLHLDPFST